MPIEEPYIDRIKKFEGFTAKPKWDYRQWSGGHGTRSAPGMVHTPESADADLRRELTEARRHVDGLGVQLQPGQRAALTSLTFNAGPGWTKAGLGQAVRRGDWQDAQSRFVQYNKAGGQVLPGLVNRRQAEAQWLTGGPAPPATVSAQAPAQPAATSLPQPQGAPAPMPTQTFKNFMTPEEAQGRRRMAYGMIGQNDGSPVQHWSQGIARVANSLVGNAWLDKVGRDEREGQQAGMEAKLGLIGQQAPQAAQSTPPARPAMAGGMIQPAGVVESAPPQPANQAALRQLLSNPHTREMGDKLLMGMVGGAQADAQAERQMYRKGEFDLQQQRRILEAKAASDPMYQAELERKRAQTRAYDVRSGSNVESIELRQQQQDRLAEEAARRQARARALIEKHNQGRLDQNSWEGAQKDLLIPINDGKPVPYADRDKFFTRIQMAGSQDPFEPNEAEKLAGITRDNKLAAYRRARINDMHGVKGEQLLNKGVRMRPDGTMEPIPGAGNTVSERQGEITAKQGIAQIDKAKEILDKSTWYERLAGDKWFQGKDGSGGFGGFGEAGRGFAAAKGGVLNYVFALSGKSVSNAERSAFVDLYMPSATDSAKTRNDKLATVRGLLEEMQKARRSGADEDQLGTLFRSYLGTPSQPSTPPIIQPPREAPRLAPPSSGGVRPESKNGGWSIKRLD